MKNLRRSEWLWKEKIVKKLIFNIRETLKHWSNVYISYITYIAIIGSNGQTFFIFIIYLFVMKYKVMAKTMTNRVPEKLFQSTFQRLIIWNINQMFEF